MPDLSNQTPPDDPVGADDARSAEPPVVERHRSGAVEPSSPRAKTSASRFPDRPQIHHLVSLFAAYAWRFLVIGAALVGLFWVLRELWVIVLALVVAVYLARALDVPTRWLRHRGAPPAAAALGSLVLLLGSLSLIGWLIIPTMADEFGALGPTITEATDDLERWLIEDSPFDLTQRDVDDLRESATEAVRNAFKSSSGGLVSGVVAAAEGLTGILLALVTTFFILKDGERFQGWVLGKVPEPRRELGSRLGARAWTTLGGYLRGVAILGTLEGIVLGITVALVGGELAWPVAIITLLAAFVPIVGAIVAGVVAVLVTLATAGTGPAVIVAIVALVVQQVDNELLAPVIYGRQLQLHPLAILFAVVAGGALFGLGGTILAVPLTAVVVNVYAESRNGLYGGDATRGPDTGDPAADDRAEPVADS